jgi:hypothetical protein
VLEWLDNLFAGQLRVIANERLQCYQFNRRDTAKAFSIMAKIIAADRKEAVERCSGCGDFGPALIWKSIEAFLNGIPWKSLGRRQPRREPPAPLTNERPKRRPS